MAVVGLREEFLSGGWEPEQKPRGGECRRCRRNQGTVDRPPGPAGRCVQAGSGPRPLTLQGGQAALPLQRGEAASRLVASSWVTDPARALKQLLRDEWPLNEWQITAGHADCCADDKLCGGRGQ